MSKSTRIREQRTMFQPCAACGALLAVGVDLLGVRPRARIAVGIAVAQHRRRMTCVACPVGSFYKPRTVAEALRDSASTRPQRIDERECPSCGAMARRSLVVPGFACSSCGAVFRLRGAA